MPLIWALMRPCTYLTGEQIRPTQNPSRVSWSSMGGKIILNVLSFTMMMVQHDIELSFQETTENIIQLVTTIKMSFWFYLDITIISLSILQLLFCVQARVSDDYDGQYFTTFYNLVHLDYNIISHTYKALNLYNAWSSENKSSYPLAPIVPITVANALIYNIYPHINTQNPSGHSKCIHGPYSKSLLIGLWQQVPQVRRVPTLLLDCSGPFTNMV